MLAQDRKICNTGSLVASENCPGPQIGSGHSPSQRVIWVLCGHGLWAGNFTSLPHQISQALPTCCKRWYAMTVITRDTDFAICFLLKDCVNQTALAFTCYPPCHQRQFCRTWCCFECHTMQHCKAHVQMIYGALLHRAIHFSLETRQHWNHKLLCSFFWFEMSRRIKSPFKHPDLNLAQSILRIDLPDCQVLGGPLMRT